jgi:hypothetical protein
MSLVLSYFTILVVLMIIHNRIYPNIHNVPVISIPWFHIYPDACVEDDKIALLQEVKPKPDVPETKADFHDSVDIEHQCHNLATTHGPVVISTKAEYVGVDSQHKIRLSGLSAASFTPQWAKDFNGKMRRGITDPFGLSAERAQPAEKAHALDACPDVEQMGMNAKRMNHRIHLEIPMPPLDARVCDRVGERLFEVQRNTSSAGGLPPLRLTAPLSGAWSVTSKEEKRMGIMLEKDAARKSVSSMFPRSVREDEWNRPLKKPPFKNGLGEGWRTADNMKRGTKGRGWRG